MNRPGRSQRAHRRRGRTAQHAHCHCRASSETLHLDAPDVVRRAEEGDGGERESLGEAPDDRAEGEGAGGRRQWSDRCDHSTGERSGSGEEERAGDPRETREGNRDGRGGLQEPSRGGDVNHSGELRGLQERGVGLLPVQGADRVEDQAQVFQLPERDED